MTKIDKSNIKRIYNYSLRNIAAFCSARNDLKTLCLKLASEPLFLILAFMQFQSFIGKLWRAKRACGAPWLGKSTHPRKFGNHVTGHRPSVRTTGKPMFNLFLASLSTGRLILHTHCKSMLWSIDSCQNRVSADQYHLTISRAQVSTHRGRVSFWSYPLTSH